MNFSNLTTISITNNERKNMNNKFHKLKKLGVHVVGMMLACFGLAGCASAAQTFSTIDYPGAVFTTSAGINRFGDVVGHYVNADESEHGYLLHKGTYTTVDFPGSDGGHVHDINSSGAIVGQYFISKRYNGFVLSGGAYTSIEFPGARAPERTE